MEQENFAAAERVFGASLKRARTLEDNNLIAGALSGLGLTALRQGHSETALERYEEMLPLYRQIGNGDVAAGDMRYVGDAQRQSGNRDAARTAYQTSLAAYRDLSFLHGVAWLLDTFAGLLAEERKTAQAARLAGAAEALWATVEYAPCASARREQKEIRACLRSLITQKLMTQEAFDLAWQQGRAMTWQSAVEEALQC